MKTIYLEEKNCLTDDQADEACGTLLREDSYHTLASGEDTAIYKPDGTLLLKLLRGRIPNKLTSLAYKTFKGAATPTGNRGMASGMGPDGVMRKPRILQDGSVSRNTEAAPVNSGIVGFFDRKSGGGRFPYCRMTAFTIHHKHEFARALPFLQCISSLFRDEVPDRYEAQRQMVEQTSPDFVIPGTVFTTMTVNRNWQTAVHKDAGDLKAGFGILSAVRSQNFRGGYLCFPKFKVAADIRTGDVLFADVHEWHGNTPMVVDGPGEFERLSFVFYYREAMFECGSAEEELQKAKKRDPADFKS